MPLAVQSDVTKIDVSSSVSFRRAVQLLTLYDSTLKEQLKPENGFVRFFQNDSELGDELGP
jgi:hypothetical protein